MDRIVDLTSAEVMLVQSALYEFIHARQLPTIQDYLDQRYPLSEGYSESFRQRKALDVAERIELATALRQRFFPNYPRDKTVVKLVDDQ